MYFWPFYFCARAKCDGSARKTDIQNVGREVGCAVDKNHSMSYDVFIALARNKNYTLMIAKECHPRHTHTQREKEWAGQFVYENINHLLSEN